MIFDLLPDDLELLLNLVFRFATNLLFVYILICVIYAKEHRLKEYSFNFFVSNILIFMLMSLMISVRLRSGVALGLFAILSILRFRTEQIQLREMTFLFSAIILGVINSLATAELPFFMVLLANVLICAGIYICEKAFIRTNTSLAVIVYDNTALLAKDKKDELHADLKSRFGYDVNKVVIDKVNFLTDSAELKVIYKNR